MPKNAFWAVFLFKILPATEKFKPKHFMFLGEQKVTLFKLKKIENSPPGKRESPHLEKKTLCQPLARIFRFITYDVTILKLI